jgi:hypothetical protein
MSATDLKSYELVIWLGFIGMVIDEEGYVCEKLRVSCKDEDSWSPYPGDACHFKNATLKETAIAEDVPATMFIFHPAFLFGPHHHNSRTIGPSSLRLASRNRKGQK